MERMSNKSQLHVVAIHRGCQKVNESTAMNLISRSFEAILWNVRYALLIAVIFSMILGVGILLVTTIDAIGLIGHMLSYANPALTDELRDKMRIETIATVVGVVDGYLIGAILLIFALGIYELFVDKIERAEGSEFASRLLLMRSLDDLKDRLANMILLIIIVKFFQQVLNTKYQNALELMYLAIGVILIAGALFLSGRAKPDRLKESAPTAKE
jgi:uncharacterized membrane protein YqhA